MKTQTTGKIWTATTKAVLSYLYTLQKEFFSWSKYLPFHWLEWKIQASHSWCKRFPAGKTFIVIILNKKPHIVLTRLLIYAFVKKRTFSKSLTGGTNLALSTSNWFQTDGWRNDIIDNSGYLNIFTKLSNFCKNLPVGKKGIKKSICYTQTLP